MPKKHFLFIQSKMSFVVSRERVLYFVCIRGSLDRSRETSLCFQGRGDLCCVKLNEYLFCHNIYREIFYCVR